jgi:pimeloyl-ACP methyl ester carboxylesterase
MFSVRYPERCSGLVFDAPLGYGPIHADFAMENARQITHAAPSSGGKIALPLHITSVHFLSRFFSSAAILVKDGRATCVKGKVSGALLTDIGTLSAEAGLREGEIWIDKIQRITFSDGIPPEFHQRFRNLIGGTG